MKPRTPGFGLIVATVGLLTLLPMRATAGMTPEEVLKFETRKALAEKGDAKGQHMLGECYIFGTGVAKNYTEAAKWHLKSALQGYAEGQLAIGFDYGFGYGVGKSYPEAVKWYRKASEQGVAWAQHQMGLSYDQGLGVTKDSVEAYAYYSLASTPSTARPKGTNRSSWAPALEKLKILEKKLSPEARLKGQQRSKELQKEIDANIAAQNAGK